MHEPRVVSMAVTNDAILKIMEMIKDGTLTPGSRLPPEQELSLELGLSRSSLREAVKALDFVRVLDVRRGDGTYVTSLEPQLLLEAMSFVVDLRSDAMMIEVTEVRRLLEPSAAGIAAQLCSLEALGALKESLDSVSTLTDVEALVQHDLEFHRLIAEASGNSYLAGLVESMSGQTTRARVWRGIAEDGAVERTVNEHRAIYQALLSRDSALASALMYAHISGIEHWLREAKGSEA